MSSQFRGPGSVQFRNRSGQQTVREVPEARRETIAAACAAFAFDAVDARLHASGENETWRIVVGTGEVYALCLHRPGYRTSAQLASLPHWMLALSGAGIRVPRPIRSQSGAFPVPVPVAEGHRFASATSWLPGTVLADELSRDVALGALSVQGSRLNRFRQIGALLAALHEHARGWTPPADFVAPLLDRDGLVGEAPRWGRFWDHPALTMEDRKLLVRARDLARERLAQSHPRLTLIHADLHPGNLLVHEDQLCVIDFDDAAWGYEPYDIATALVHQQARPDFLALRAALIEGYRTVRMLADADLGDLSLFCLLRDLAIVGWLMQRPDMQAKTAAAFSALLTRVRVGCSALADGK